MSLHETHFNFVFQAETGEHGRPSRLFLRQLQFPAACNREEMPVTAVGGPQEVALVSARKKNLPEARAPRHRRSGNQGPIAEESWRQASPKHSAHALPGIFWSLRSSKRPISRWVFR